MKKVAKIIFYSIYLPTEVVLAILQLLFIYILFSSTVSTPKVPDITIAKRQKIADNYYVLGNNYLKKNEYGIWEMYLEGDAYERGLIYGELAKELNQEQEEIFVAQINNWVPKGAFQNFLKIMMGFFTSKIPDHISLENQQEIYGISKTFSDEFDYIAPKYTRILGYHAAHDMGHALNDYSVVGCTSFALTQQRTADGQLIIGRNFDFYVGDDFAKNKLIWFVNPTKGYKFVSYTWAGFTGVCSGMNEKGLTVTINASKSDLPTGSKAPISILAREILQYAKNVQEAIKIAKKRETFVSETLMIGSASDNTTILIEKSPTKIGIYEMKDDELTCANHYQSSTFAFDSINILNIKNSDSKYRFDRVNELLSMQQKYTPEDVAKILRDQKAANGDTLGMGNPRALNQLLAHHSVIMLPMQRKIYITTSDFQLGKFIAYDLKKTFASKKAVIMDQIAEDPFIHSKDYQDFLVWRQTKHQIGEFLLFNKPLGLSQKQIEQFIAQNSESYVTYESLGNYFSKKKAYRKAIAYYQTALTKNVASPAIEQELKNAIEQCKKKLG